MIDVMKTDDQLFLNIPLFVECPMCTKKLILGDVTFNHYWNGYELEYVHLDDADLNGNFDGYHQKAELNYSGQCETIVTYEARMTHAVKNEEPSDKNE